MTASGPVADVVVLACTCGAWAGSATADRCPRCAAERMVNRNLLDFAATPWEELDVRDRRYGLFYASGESPDPIAIFRTPGECGDWIDWQRSRGGDARVGSADDLCVLPIDRLSGIAWNDVAPPPDPGSPWPILVASTPVDVPTDPDPEVSVAAIVAASATAETREVARAAIYAFPIAGCVPLLACSIASSAGLGAPDAISWVALPAFVLCSVVTIWIVYRAHRRAHRRATRCR